MHRLRRPSPAPRPVSPSRVLVVDDEAEVRSAAAAILGGAGYEVRLAEDGMDALVEFEDYPPAMVLLDVSLPGRDGFQTCRQMRALRGGRETPIVFLARQEDCVDEHAVSHCEGDDALAKPLGSTELVLRVRSLLSLRAQRDAVAQAMRNRQISAAHAVHDLRSPLTSVNANLQFLLRDPHLPPDVRSAARDALDALEVAARMTNDLLDIHLSEDGVLSPRLVEIDLRRMLEDLRRHGIRRASATVSHTLVVSTRLEHPTLLADRLLLWRILENLLDNAIRHAPPDSTIHLEARSFSSDMIELRVRDEGPGIPEPYRELVFEPYAQIDSDSALTARPGRGLGLAFCRAAASAHGGRIWVEDNLPRGACFCVRLPTHVVGSVHA